MIVTYPLLPFSRSAAFVHMGRHPYCASDELSMKLPQPYMAASGLHPGPLAETGCNVSKWSEQQLLICNGQ